MEIAVQIITDERGIVPAVAATSDTEYETGFDTPGHSSDTACGPANAALNVHVSKHVAPLPVTKDAVVELSALTTKQVPPPDHEVELDALEKAYKSNKLSGG